MRVSPPASFISTSSIRSMKPLTTPLCTALTLLFMLMRLVLLCRSKKERKSMRDATLDGFMHVPAQNETALAQAVSQHPVAVAVCCGDNIDNWHQYTGGIFEIPNTGRPQP